MFDYTWQIHSVIVVVVNMVEVTFHLALSFFLACCWRTARQYLLLTTRMKMIRHTRFLDVVPVCDFWFSPDCIEYVLVLFVACFFYTSTAFSLDSVKMKAEAK